MKIKFTVLLVLGSILFQVSSCAYSKSVSSSAQNSRVMKMQSEVKGDGIPIVLVGGGLTGWASWEPFVPTFNAQSRQVIRVQLLSVQLGLENRHLPADYAISLESDALAATLDALGMALPVDVVAWSFGAMVSLDFALDHPGRIRTLTLIEPPALWVLRETGKMDEQAAESAAFFQEFTGVITEEMLEKFLHRAGLVPPGRSARELPQWNNWVSFRQSLRNNPYVVSHQDERQRLKNFSAPTLLVKGTGSTPWLHKIVEGLAENMPHAKVVEFPGGHAPHLVAIEQFLTELEAFQNNSGN